MRVTTNDIHSHLFTAEAEEEESAGNAVDNDIERVDGRYITVKEAI